MAEEDHKSNSDANMDSSSSDDSSSSSSTDTESDEQPVNEKITLKARKDKHTKGRPRWKLMSDRNFFRKEWHELFPWVEENPNDPKSAICSVCHSTMKASKNILDVHQKSKKHLRNDNGPDYVEEPRKEEKPEVKTTSTAYAQPFMAGMDQLGDDQISFFTESAADAAHQAVTTLIDKLVEKYHENRLENLKVQNEAILQLNVERAKLIRSENQRKLERRIQQEAFLKEAQEIRLKCLQLQHETKLNAMEDERDAKLRAVEQELVFAKQEYEKKVRLLDSQLSSMK